MKTWLIGIGSVLAAIFAAFIAGRKNGQEKIVSEQNEQVLKNVSDAKKSNEIAANLSDAERRKWLYDNSLRK